MRAALPGIGHARAFRALQDGAERLAWLTGDGRQDSLYILEVDGSVDGDWPTLELLHDAIQELTPGAAFTLLGAYLMGLEATNAPRSVLLLQAGAVEGTPAAHRLQLSNLGGNHGKGPRLIT
jgi:hypothetical protein